jgi:hypothetical protein
MMNLFILMKVDPVTVMNWMAVIFLTPAAALFAWEFYRLRVKGKSTKDLITAGLLLALAPAGVLSDNFEGWTNRVLLLVQFGLLVLLYNRLWPTIKRLFRSDSDPTSGS